MTQVERCPGGLRRVEVMLTGVQGTPSQQLGQAPRQMQIIGDLLPALLEGLARRVAISVQKLEAGLRFPPTARTVYFELGEQGSGLIATPQIQPGPRLPKQVLGFLEWGLDPLHQLQTFLGLTGANQGPGIGAAHWWDGLGEPESLQLGGRVRRGEATGLRQRFSNRTLAMPRCEGQGAPVVPLLQERAANHVGESSIFGETADGRWTRSNRCGCITSCPGAQDQGPQSLRIVRGELLPELRSLPMPSGLGVGESQLARNPAVVGAQRV